MIYVLNEDYAPLYHCTDIVYFIQIMESNVLKATHDKSQSSDKLLYFTRNKNYVARQGDTEALQIRLKFDKNKLTTKYKIEPYENIIRHSRYDKDKYSEQAEICRKDINNVFDYITEIEIIQDVNPEFDEFLELVKEYNITDEFMKYYKNPFYQLGDLGDDLMDNEWFLDMFDFFPVFYASKKYKIQLGKHAQFAKNKFDKALSNM